jgi:plastocyanin
MVPIRHLPRKAVHVDLCGLASLVPESTGTIRRVKLPPHYIALSLLTLFSGPPASANELTVSVSDVQGRPARNVVVVATPKAPVSVPARPVTTVEMDQVDRQFSPYVLAVHTGTPVLFVNNDSIAHQVYSFSPPKRFELALYHGKPRQPVVFDRPGIVTVGCNIHDNMVGYVYVTDAPWFGTTGKDGVWKASDLPAGAYQLEVWTPLLPAHESLLTQSVVVGDASTSASFQLKRALRPEPAPIKDTRVRDY